MALAACSGATNRASSALSVRSVDSRPVRYDRDVERPHRARIRAQPPAADARTPLRLAECADDDAVASTLGPSPGPPMAPHDHPRRGQEPVAATAPPTNLGQC